jgi:hypothetical protein
MIEISSKVKKKDDNLKVIQKKMVPEFSAPM